MNTKDDQPIEKQDELREHFASGWGEKCAEYEPNCPACIAWRWYEGAGEEYLKELIADRENRAREEQFNKSVEVMKDILAESFHYRLMCGEIKDPSGKIDVHKAFVEYQELEPERQKFTAFIEDRLATLRNKQSEEESDE